MVLIIFSISVIKPSISRLQSRCKIEYLRFVMHMQLQTHALLMINNDVSVTTSCGQRLLTLLLESITPCICTPIKSYQETMSLILADVADSVQRFPYQSKESNFEFSAGQQIYNSFG